MVSTNGGDDTAFRCRWGYRPGVTTGTSAHDRAVTAAAVVDRASGRRISIARPCVPLRAKEGGVLRRAGHTGRPSISRSSPDSSRRA
jgi:3,4-dihydroxy 2-butanone 4-phosphate synthase/GTP cyclohydrolase II